MKKIAFIFCLCLSVIHLFAGEREGDFKTNKNVFVSIRFSICIWFWTSFRGLRYHISVTLGNMLALWPVLLFKTGWTMIINLIQRWVTEKVRSIHSMMTVNYCGGNWLIGTNFRTPSVSLGRERIISFFFNVSRHWFWHYPTRLFHMHIILKKAER